MSRRYYSQNDKVEELVALLEDCSESLSLGDAYDVLCSGDTYSEDSSMQSSIFIVQQIFEACDENRGDSTEHLMREVRMRLKQFNAELRNVIEGSYYH